MQSEDASSLGAVASNAPAALALSAALPSTSVANGTGPTDATAPNVPQPMPITPMLLRESAPTESRWVRPWPQGNDLNSVWMSPSGEFTAVGDGGTVVQFTKDAQNWRLRQLGDFSLRVVWGPSDERIYLLGDGGRLFVSLDRGRTFVLLSTGTNENLLSICGQGDELFIGASKGILLYSADAGAHWTQQRLPSVTQGTHRKDDVRYGNNDLVSIAIGPSGRIVIAARAGIHYSDSHGKTWKRPLLTSEAFGFSIEGEKDWLYFAKVLAYRDEFLIPLHGGIPAGGFLPNITWIPLLTLQGDKLKPWRLTEDVATPEELAERLAKLDEEAEVKGARELSKRDDIYRPNDHADMWINAGGSVAIVGSNSMAWAAPQDVTLHDTLPGHANVRDPLCGIAIAGDDGHLYSVGDGGAICRSTDEGRHWQSVDTTSISVAKPSLSSVWAEGEEVLIFGNSSENFCSWHADQGLFSMRPSGLSRAMGWSHVGGVRWIGKEMLVSGEGGLARSSDGGRTWTEERTIDGKAFSAGGLWASVQNDVVVAATFRESNTKQSSRVILRRQGSNPWDVFHLSDGEYSHRGRRLNGLSGNSEGVVYALDRPGLFYRSTDNGAHFTKIGYPLNESIDAVHAGLGQNVWILATRYIGKKEQNRLRFSKDGGNHFSDVPPPPGPGEISAIGGSPLGEVVVAHHGHIYERIADGSEWVELTNGAFAATSLGREIHRLAVPAARRVIAISSGGIILEIRPKAEIPGQKGAK